MPRQLIQQVRDVVELKEELDPRQVHATLLREIPDHPHAMQILVGVQTNVRLRPDRLEETFLLVDPQCARVTTGQACRDGDHVDRSIAVRHSYLHKT